MVDLLNEYERAKPRQRLHGPKKILHAAAIWERLSLGLNMLFVEWVRKHSGNGRRQFEREVSAALRSRQGAGAFADIDLDKLDSPAIVRGAVASLRKALDLREALPDEDQKVFDSEMFTLAERLVHSRGDFFQEARRRHLDVKGDDAWINENGELGDREGNSLLVPSKVRLHPYRIEAFARIIRDLA
ncbi:MAG TPA: hypothetical protein VND64_23860 [Pirellulales bacterium]|nr:hypothetical protein [Pirellulales bacterium]